MRNVLLISLLTMASFAAMGQATQSDNKGVISSPRATGVQIQGNTEIKAEQKDVNAVVSGENNTAKNAAGTIKGGTQIQGNTKIKAKQHGANAAATGKNNSSANESGAIGGK